MLIDERQLHLQFAVSEREDLYLAFGFDVAPGAVCFACTNAALTSYCRQRKEGKRQQCEKASKESAVIDRRYRRARRQPALPDHFMRSNVFLRPGTELFVISY